MTPPLQRALWACVLLGTLPALLVATGGGADDGRPPPLDLPAALKDKREEGRRSEQLLGWQDTIEARLAANRAAADDLANGRLSLPEAAARLRALHAGDSELIRESRLAACGTDSDDVAAYREAINQVRLLLRGRPECAAVVGRLEADLAGRQASPAGLEFPAAE
jgi:hypothetical protein